MKKLLSTLCLSIVVQADMLPQNVLLKNCLDSYKNSYLSQKNHKAFVYARESDTGKDRCNWSYGYSSIEEAIESAMKGCQSVALNAECRVVDRDGLFEVSDGAFTKLVPIDDTPLSKEERKKLNKEAKGVIRGNCLPFFDKNYLTANGNKAFAYSIDANGNYACGYAYGHSFLEASKKQAIKSCSENKLKRGDKAPKSPCKVYAIDKQIVLSLSDFGIKVEPKKDKFLSSEEYSKQLERAKEIIDDGACLMQMKYYLRGKTQQAYYFAKSSNKQACGRKEEAFTMKQAKVEAKKSCEKMAKERGIKSGCKLLAQNYEIVGKASDFGGLKEGKEDFVNAIYKGNIKKIKSYIEKGYDVNTISPKAGMTPLFVAAGKGDKEFFDELIKKGADINHKANDGSSLLIAAVLGRNVNIVRTLLKKGLDINLKGTDGNTPLHASFIMLNTYIAGILMRHGADASIKNDKGVSGYDLAKKWKVDLNKMKTLKANEPDYDGTLPLFYASKNGDEEGIKKLVAQKANLNHVDSRGFSPLCIAKDIKTIKLLLKLGSDINAQDDDGNTPLMNLATMMGEKEKVKALLNLGADTSIKNKEGKTVFDLVAEDKFVSKEIKELFQKKK